MKNEWKDLIVFEGSALIMFLIRKLFGIFGMFGIRLNSKLYQIIALVRGVVCEIQEEGVRLAELLAPRCRLRALPDSFGALHALVRVDLSGNQLERISEEAARGFGATRELDVSRNKLVELPEAFGFLGDNPAGKIEISAKNIKLDVDGGMFGLVGKDVAFKKNADLELSGFDEVRIEAESVGIDFKSSINFITPSTPLIPIILPER